MFTAATQTHTGVTTVLHGRQGVGRGRKRRLLGRFLGGRRVHPSGIVVTGLSGLRGVGGRRRLFVTVKGGDVVLKSTSGGRLGRGRDDG